jgi:hypothetical protein
MTEAALGVTSRLLGSLCPLAAIAAGARGDRVPALVIKCFHPTPRFPTHPTHLCHTLSFEDTVGRQCGSAPS